MSLELVETLRKLPLAEKRIMENARMLSRNLTAGGLAALPMEWARTPRGVLNGATCQAARPADGAAKSGRPIDRGLLRDWLIIGPFKTEDAAKALAQEQILDEPRLAPKEGDKVVDHCYGLKVWLNGEVVYENADRGQGLGKYVGISRQK